MKTILVTGACGNIGALTVALLASRGYAVRALDLGAERHRELAATWPDSVTPVWGDICDATLAKQAVEGTDHVVHLAAVIPPVTDENQLLAYRVNVVGTRTLLAACESCERPPRFTFSSSAAVFGNNAAASGPRKSDEDVFPEDSYTRQKVECEQRIRASRLDHVIFRLGLTPPLTPSSISSFIFDFHPDTRVEFTHPRDLALGLCNSLLTSKVVGRTLMLGGGAHNRSTYLEWLNAAFESMGIASLPRSAFGNLRFYTDWVDSEESQALLDYQRHSYGEYLEEISDALGPLRHVAKGVGPLARAYALGSSRHYAEAEGRAPRLPDALKKIGVVRRALGAAAAFVPPIPGERGRAGAPPELEALLEAFAVPRLEGCFPPEFLARHGLGRPQQYGIAVRDVSAACSKAEALGAGPFVRASIPSPGWTEGGEARPGCKLEFALGYVGDQQVEFLGPGEGTDFYVGALQGREAVLHHGGFYQAGVETIGRSLEIDGFAEAVRGGVRLGRALCFDFRYYDTRAELGLYVEVLDFGWLGGRPLDLGPGIRAYASTLQRMRR